MKQQSGRSLIEILGVLTVGTVMIAAAAGMYRAIDQRQKRVVALETMKDIVTNIKTLKEYSGNYKDVSIDYLIHAGVLKNAKAPIGSEDWAIKPTDTGFAIYLYNLSYDECAFFATKNIEWASYVVINGTSVMYAANTKEDAAVKEDGIVKENSTVKPRTKGPMSGQQVDTDDVTDIFQEEPHNYDFYTDDGEGAKTCSNKGNNSFIFVIE